VRSGPGEPVPGSRYRLASALPSLSRPLYECILTGSTPVESGIVHNGVNRLSNRQSLFHLARDAGLVTAAAAYHWISELYNRSPYDARRDRFTHDAQLPIAHGVFYHADDYPDEHLLLDAEALRRAHAPDFLFIHPMNVDDAGHRHGLDSAEYRNAARRIDTLLSGFLPDWMDAGYQILITSDHGMNRDGSHGGNLTEEREVPLYLLGEAFNHQGTESPRQTALCGLIADLLDLAHDKPRHPELIA
jgi:predicted AlkP superfamily pyrophosphatase or phosphodiesterase